MNDVAETTRHRRSVSQLQTYAGCSYEYYLSRVLKVPQRQASWFIQGLSVHQAVEAYEKSGRELSVGEALQVFEAAWNVETAEAERLQPDPRMWMFGRGKTKDSDAEHRWNLGRRQVEDYIDWHPRQGAEWYPLELAPGQLAVEVKFDLHFGHVRVIGAIDSIMTNRSGDIAVVDVKTGTKKPSDPYQMATYRFAVKELFDLDINGAQWWMCKDTRYEPFTELGNYSYDEVCEWYSKLDKGIENEIFLANPGDCFTCPVKPYCKYGSKSPLDITPFV